MKHELDFIIKDNVINNLFDQKIDRKPTEEERDNFIAAAERTIEEFFIRSNR